MQVHLEALCSKGKPEAFVTKHLTKREKIAIIMQVYKVNEFISGGYYALREISKYN